jgi:alpha-galactosidase
MTGSISMKTIRLLGSVAAFGLAAQLAGAVSPIPAEMNAARRWAAARFETVNGAKPFFSFLYGGKSSTDFLGNWDLKRASRQIDDKRAEHTLTYTDPKTGLVVRCVGAEGRDFPTVEWTLYFKNTGNQNTPVLSDIQAMDTLLAPKGSGDVLLRHFKGDSYTKDSFEPFETKLTSGIDRRFAPVGGRSSNGEWPYYNLGWNGGGVMLAIGWPGQWACRFTRDPGAGVRVRAGQELTHFTLHPGEEVRTPLIALMFYQRDWIAAQNLWRRWMFDQNFPKEHGKPLSPKLAGFAGNYFPGYRTDQKGEIAFIDRYVEEGIKLDYWWIDAGWYPCPVDWGPVGTWEVDRNRYPGGLRAVSDHVHAKGMQFILWFEPERVTGGSWLAVNHPEWVLGGKGGGLLDLGNPAAWNWLVDRIDKLIVSEGVDIYRQDFNMDPLSYWRAHDTSDRQGITEVKHVQGYLAYWDELRRRHPGMLIDSCASGGRRDDLETMRRAVPFLRSDYCTDSEGMQCHTYGFNLWLPYYRGATDKIETYDFRSNISPLMMLAGDMRNRGLDYALPRKLIGQWRRAAPYLFGDFYPLTNYSLANNVWMAWQFNCAEKREGLVQAFRREKGEGESIRVKLQGLDPALVYTLTNFDVAGTTEMGGRQLMEQGLTIAIKNRPGAVVITYKKKA